MKGALTGVSQKLVYGGVARNMGAIDKCIVEIDNETIRKEMRAGVWDGQTPKNCVMRQPRLKPGTECLRSVHVQLSVVLHLPSLPSLTCSDVGMGNQVQ